LNLIKVFMLKLFYKNKLYLGKGVKVLGSSPYFKIPRNGKIVIGNNVVLNSDFKRTNTALTYKCKFVTGYDGEIVVGENSMLNGVCVVSYLKVKIGKYCQIASSTIISDTDFHPVDPIQRLKQVIGEPFSYLHVGKKEVSIGNNVWIGWNCTILKGVTIGDNCIVAAGSVVLSGIYPDSCLIAGNPAKIVKQYSAIDFV
jgi:acetyltransferase-like isoleucine patch superfamily enzyme